MTTGVKTRARGKASAGLALTWVIAGAIVLAARATKPVPATIFASLRDLDNPERRAVFAPQLAAKMNRLRFEEHETVRRSAEYCAAYQRLTPAEKAQFLTATAPASLRRLLDAIAGMPPGKRHDFLNETAQQADSLNWNLGDDPIAKERVRRLGEDALRDYLEHASPAVRDELLPELDQMRKYLRMW